MIFLRERDHVVAASRLALALFREEKSRKTSGTRVSSLFLVVFTGNVCDSDLDPDHVCGMTFKSV